MQLCRWGHLCWWLRCSSQLSPCCLRFWIYPHSPRLQEERVSDYFVVERIALPERVMILRASCTTFGTLRCGYFALSCSNNFCRGTPNTTILTRSLHNNQWSKLTGTIRDLALLFQRNRGWQPGQGSLVGCRTRRSTLNQSQFKSQQLVILMMLMNKLRRSSETYYWQCIQLKRNELQWLFWTFC